MSLSVDNFGKWIIRNNFASNFKTMFMRGKICLVLAASVMLSCSKEGMVPDTGSGRDRVNAIPHEMIVLGKRLENPYKTENMTKALATLYPTKAGLVAVEPTDLYVRFLPKNQDELDVLTRSGVVLMDHPLDYDILVEGDWYHDPEVPEDNVTWQYAVVPVEFEFPDIEHQIIHNCFIPDAADATRAPGIDWEAVERRAYIITGNEGRLNDAAVTKSGKVTPSGRITIVDKNANGGKPFGVAGVRVSCNSFVRFAHTYTDRDGYYQMPKHFSANLRYRLVFENEKGFSIGFNLVLVPASVSTLGKAGPEGVSAQIDASSETKLFRRCVVNNAAYDYISRCSYEDMNLQVPPADLRIWIFHSLTVSSAVMLHHGAVVESELLSSFFGNFTSLLTYFLPDVTIGAEGKDDYASLYSTVCHELAHSSHFAQVGTGYWNRYIRYILESYFTTGDPYGDGQAGGAEYCSLGESWAYYLESLMYKERYGGSVPSFGSSYWFYPQIFRYLDERGVDRSDIFSVLKSDVVTKGELKSSLIRSFPHKRTVIEQVFGRYGN